MGKESYGVADLHCHILPGIDDGSPNLETSAQLLQSEKDAGVENIIFTPHFYADRMNAEEFFTNREAAYAEVLPACEKLGLNTDVGAELYMVPELADLDLSRFTLGDTHYLLLEWPFMSSTMPLWGGELVDKLLASGIRPVFAHIERYEYFFQNEKNLEPFIEKGVLCQMNASAVLKKDIGKRAINLIKRGYVHVVASDAHNLERRPVRLAPAFDHIQKHLGSGACEVLTENSVKIFGDEEVFVQPPKKKSVGLFWR